MKRLFPCLSLVLLLSACTSSPPSAPMAANAVDPAATAAQAAVARATADTKVAGAYGLDKTSWDLVRIAQEDIAAAVTSIDNGEYPEAEKLAAGASASLRQAIAKACAALRAKTEADLDAVRQADDADEDLVTAAEYHLALAQAAADEGDFLKAKEIVDEVNATLDKAAADKH